ncbi:Maintenance of telomere capping protein 1 [Fusarium oxysporum f. sp. albedinis]|nr:Maintenance of telomere capping protein 1 [Fusarium oxysporum f. sp. albedinis]
MVLRYDFTTVYSLGMHVKWYRLGLIQTSSSTSLIRLQQNNGQTDSSNTTSTDAVPVQYLKSSEQSEANVNFLGHQPFFLILPPISPSFPSTLWTLLSIIAPTFVARINRLSQSACSCSDDFFYSFTARRVSR